MAAATEAAALGKRSREEVSRMAEADEALVTGSVSCRWPAEGLVTMSAIGSNGSTRTPALPEFSLSRGDEKGMSAMVCTKTEEAVGLALPVVMSCSRATPVTTLPAGSAGTSGAAASQAAAFTATGSLGEGDST